MFHGASSILESKEPTIVWAPFQNLPFFRNGCPQHRLKEYTSEFLRRQKHKEPDCFFHFWDTVAKIYQCEGANVAEVDDEHVPQDYQNEEPDVVNNRLSLDRVFIEDF